MEEALSSGGEYADIFCEYSTQEVLTLRDGEVNAIRNDIDFRAGIRVCAVVEQVVIFESTDMKHLRNSSTGGCPYYRESGR